MPKLRKTLPKNFQELIQNGVDEEIQAALMKCEVGAYDYPSSKNTALFYTGLSRGVIEWLLARGERLNHRNSYGRIPLHAQAEVPNGAVLLYLELGAEVNAVDRARETPLFRAAVSYQTENMKILLAHGADMYQKSKVSGCNALEAMLSQSTNGNIEKAVSVSEIFLSAGMPVSPAMQKSVTRMGRDYEFFKNLFLPQTNVTAKQGIERLYELFDVLPVPPIEQW